MKQVTCPEYSAEAFLELIAGDIPFWRRWRMESHLKHCPVCTAEYKTIQELFAATRAASEALVPEDNLSNRIWVHISEREGRASAPGSNNAGRMPRRHTVITGFSIACAVLLGVLLTWSPERSGEAFARVEAAMGDVKTATWTETTTSITDWEAHNGRQRKGTTRRSVEVSEYENWVEFVPLHLARRERLRNGQTVESGAITISDGEFGLCRQSSGTQYYRYRVESSPFLDGGRTSSPRQRIRREVIFPFDMLKTFGERRITTPKIEQTGWRLKKDQLNGRSVLRFSCQVKRNFRPRKPGIPRIEENWIIWAEPSTHRIVRREINGVATGSFGRSEYRRISENFRYNITPPPGTFAIAAPAVDQPFEFQDISSGAEKRWNADPVEQQQIAAIIHECVVAWNHQDTPTFTRHFDFVFPDQHKAAFERWKIDPDKARLRQQQWVDRIKRRTPYSSWQIENIGPAEGYGWIYVRKAEADPFPPDCRPTVYAVDVKGQAVLSPGGKPIPCDATFLLFRKEGQFFVTDIEMRRGRKSP